ncbi:hypothetical protein [Afipia broomeae]|uniref:Uncharacterized protein n=1 Tax=Afipia broomeae ATCC 49717 TaxID=883078 RepID=K8PRW4_9BRAD|nr:hypothetical protein [Afipia broomeae]EKS41108.1 hypothetical protein HMPREF9695_00200 [Afipia broomeae ATCC 49717]
MTSDLLAERDLYAAHLERLRGKRPHDEVLAYSRSFRKLIDTSADFVGEDLPAGHEGLARSIRDVIETITVVPAPAGQQAHDPSERTPRKPARRAVVL